MPRTRLSDDDREAIASKTATTKALDIVERYQLTAARTNSKMTDAMVEVILTEVAAGRTVKAVCEELGLASGVLYNRASRNPELKDRLNAAREIAQHSLVDTLLEIPFDDRLSDASKKLLSDNLKWTASRQNKDAYGDKPLIGSIDKLIVTFDPSRPA